MLNDAFKLTLDVVYPPLKGDALPDRGDLMDDVLNGRINDEKFAVD